MNLCKACDVSKSAGEALSHPGSALYVARQHETLDYFHSCLYPQEQKLQWRGPKGTSSGKCNKLWHPVADLQEPSEQEP